MIIPIMPALKLTSEQVERKESKNSPKSLRFD